MMNSIFISFILILFSVSLSAMGSGPLRDGFRSYAPRMPPIYPDRHEAQSCIPLNGHYQVTERQSRPGGNLPKPIFDFATRTGSLPYFYDFTNKFDPSSGSGGVGWSSAADGEFRMQGLYKAFAIFCDKDGTDFVTATYTDAREPIIYSRLRIEQGAHPDEFKFFECTVGFWGSTGIIKKVP